MRSDAGAGAGATRARAPCRLSAGSSGPASPSLGRTGRELRGQHALQIHAGIGFSWEHGPAPVPARAKGQRAAVGLAGLARERLYAASSRGSSHDDAQARRRSGWSCRTTSPAARRCYDELPARADLGVTIVLVHRPRGGVRAMAGVYGNYWIDPWSADLGGGPRTSTIRLGTGVLVLPYRNPVLAAKMIASIDVFSSGRVESRRRHRLEPRGVPAPSQVITRCARDSPRVIEVSRCWRRRRVLRAAPAVPTPRSTRRAKQVDEAIILAASTGLRYGRRAPPVPRPDLEVRAAPRSARPAGRSKYCRRHPPGHGAHAHHVAVNHNESVTQSSARRAVRRASPRRRARCSAGTSPTGRRAWHRVMADSPRRRCGRALVCQPGEPKTAARCLRAAQEQVQVVLPLKPMPPWICSAWLATKSSRPVRTQDLAMLTPRPPAAEPAPAPAPASARHRATRSSASRLIRVTTRQPSTPPAGRRCGVDRLGSCRSGGRTCSRWPA